MSFADPVAKPTRTEDPTPSLPWCDLEAGDGREATFVLLRAILVAGRDFPLGVGADIFGAIGMSGAAGGRGASVPADLGRLGAVGRVGAVDRRDFTAGAEVTGFRFGTAAIFGAGGGCSGVAFIDGADIFRVAAVLAGSFGVVARRVAVRRLVLRGVDLVVLRRVDLAFFFVGGRSLMCPEGAVPLRLEITGNCSVLLA